MMRNDYRRSLIMLRNHVQGYSGHVRLERRTLMGTLYAVINAPNDGSILCASLVRRDRQGNYIGVRLGELRRDGRGQASLAYSFDPRNIGGVPLEDYWLIAIVSRDRLGRCTVALSGSVNGSREMDWNGVQAAACAACRENRPPACEFCPPDDRPASPGVGPLGPQTPALPPMDQPASPGEGPVELPTPVGPDGNPALPGEGPENLPTPEIPSGEAAAPDEGPLGLPTPDVPVPDTPEIAFASARNAAAELGLDASAPWPGAAEQVREYFASQPVKEMMLGDGFTYVSAPMPEGSGYDHIAVGLKVQDGIPAEVSYALPSKYSAAPPQGLENYAWKGGAADGWWVIYTDSYTGERLS